MPTHKTRQTSAIVAIMLVAVLLGIAAATYYQRPPAPSTIPGLLWPNPKMLGEFSVLDQNGKAFTLAQLKDKWSLLFFGFTHCPDICPNTLQLMQQMEKRLKSLPEQNDSQFIFVSVDPKRDTPKIMHDYLDYFSKDFIGLTGDPQVEELNRQIGVIAILGQADENGSYSVDHSASVFIIDPAGRMVGKLSLPHTLENMLDTYQKIRSYIEDNS